MKETKKKVGKNVGIISCVIAGLYGFYQLANTEEVKELACQFVGNGSKFREMLRTQIKQCVKEAIAEYEAERMERERQLNRVNKITSKKTTTANEIIANVVQSMTEDNN